MVDRFPLYSMYILIKINIFSRHFISLYDSTIPTDDRPIVVYNILTITAKIIFYYTISWFFIFQCLFTKWTNNISYYSIKPSCNPISQSICYKIRLYFYVNLNKISLSCFDDKRYIHENGITSYAYGHYKIN